MNSTYVVIKAYKFTVFEFWRDFNVLLYIACPCYPYIRVCELYDISCVIHMIYMIPAFILILYPFNSICYSEVLKHSRKAQSLEKKQWFTSLNLQHHYCRRCICLGSTSWRKRWRSTKIGFNTALQKTFISLIRNQNPWCTLKTLGSYARTILEDLANSWLLSWYMAIQVNSSWIF